MRGPLVVVACACGAVATLVAPHAHGFQLPWRLSQQQPPRSLALRSGSGCTRRHATSLFGLESLLQPAARAEAARTPQQEQQQQQQQQPQQQQNNAAAAVAAARIKEMERGVSRLAVTFGWCLSPADQQYINEAWAGLKPSLAHLSDVERTAVEAALEVGYHAHLGQKRKSGEPYIVHPLAVARIVADMGMDGETIAAALLHDTVEDTMLRAADVEAVFGPAVRQIVEGETKVSKLPRQLVSALEAGLSDKAAANLTHLLLAMARDWRVVVVKLSDRLHNCRTLAFMAPAKQVSVSKETLAVYVPLAERLGLNSVKAELEELCFQYLHPLEHAAVTAAVASRQQLLASLHTNRFGGVRLTMDAALTEALPRLVVTRGSLKGHRVTAALEGANPFQVFQRWAARGPQGGSRLLEEGLEGERDLLTLKVVVSVAASRGDAEAEHALCTRVLEAVEAELHAASVEGKREDFVRFPKANGYQALHAVLRVPGLPYPLQVRVQTEEMERVARHGLLALYAPRSSAGASSSSSSSSSAAEGSASASAVPLQLPWLEAISARTRRAVLRDPSVTAAQLIASLQEELAVKQLEWAEAAQQAAAAGGRLKPTAGDVLEFVVRSALEEQQLQQQQQQGVMVPGQQEQQQQAQQEQRQQQQVLLVGVEPRFWQSPVFLWPWSLIGNDDFTGSKGPASAAAMQQRRRELQRQARGAVTAQRPQGAFDSGEVQWLREAEQRHGRLALALLAYWGLQAMTDWANAASATALAPAELADILEGSSPTAAVDASVLLETLLVTPFSLPALPSLSPALLAVVGAGELIGAVLPNTIEVNKRWQEARQERLARQRRRLMGGSGAEGAEDEEDSVVAAAADAQAAMAATVRASRSQQREAVAGFIPLVGGSASVGSGVGGALLRLEAPWGLVRAFEGMLKAEKAMGRLGMLTILILLAVLT